ncbi:hypothetical protein GH714_024893 [Hevea brasiliensis]|uniref:DUF4219 domain-containing protein n=1 Tax=Hevea brasiliensis TaxID=3981 RepID=A0A6A6M0A1_HEVBR|nr:hypothetical protein GH714_024893 [Hevea brasiliensis]
MTTFFRAYDLWDVVDTGRDPTPLPPNPTLAQIKYHSDECAKKYKALTFIHQAISDSIFPRIVGAQIAEEAWDKLKEEFQGSERVAEARLENNSFVLILKSEILDCDKGENEKKTSVWKSDCTGVETKEGQCKVAVFYAILMLKAQNYMFAAMKSRRSSRRLNQLQNFQMTKVEEWYKLYIIVEDAMGVATFVVFGCLVVDLISLPTSNFSS